MSRNPTTRLNELLAALCDEHISSTEFGELEQLLAADEEHRREYFKYLLLHGELNWDRGARQSELPGRTSTGHATRELPPADWKSPAYWHQHRLRFATAALAATILLWAGFLFWVLPWWQDVGDVNVAHVDSINHSLAATVTALQSPKWKEGASQWQWGTKLRAGRQVSLTSGTVELTFHDGAQVLLEGPCEFSVDTPGAGTLKHGKLAAHVPLAAQGFTVLSELATIVDLGTEFGVVVLENGTTQCVVLSGSVEIARQGNGSGPKLVRLTKHQAAMFTADGQTIEFQQQADATLVAAMRSRLMQLRKPRPTSAADSNPSPAKVTLIGHWKFDEGSGTTAFDSSRHANHATQIATGSWIQGKSGGAYNRPQFKLADSTDYRITGAVTVSAWVKPNAANRFSVIAGIDKYGAFDDMYALKTNNEDKIDWYLAGVDEPITSTDTLTNYSKATVDSWVHLVGVFRPGISSALYINGALNSSAPGHASNPRHEIDFRIGNYPNNQGPFNGAVDDVQVYRGALSAKEVEYLFNNPGKAIESSQKDAHTGRD